MRDDRDERDERDDRDGDDRLESAASSVALRAAPSLSDVDRNLSRIVCPTCSEESVAATVSETTSDEWESPSSSSSSLSLSRLN